MAQPVAIAPDDLLSERQQRPVYALILHIHMMIRIAGGFSYIVGAFDT